jgi:hypothetical protein
MKFNDFEWLSREDEKGERSLLEKMKGEGISTGLGKNSNLAVIARSGCDAAISKS